MATSDVTLQDGVKHPYLLALVRWCVSSFWSTATVILHRFITTPIPQIKAPKPARSRPASYDHLHPEPRVDCEVLHTPDHHKLDVIFVHGLYGSLGNTWRQGEWQTKYDKQPNKVPLRRPHAVPTCQCKDEQTKCCSGGTINILTDDDQISQKNEINDTNGEIQCCNSDKDDESKDKVEINDTNYERNNKYTNEDTNSEIKHYCVDNNDGILHRKTKNNKFDKIRQENLKRDADIRKSDYSVAKSDKISENNVNIDGFVDKIKDFEVQLPPSNFQEIMSGINVHNDHIKGLDGKINDSKANTSLYDTIRDINTQIDCNNYSNEDNMNAEDNPNLYDNLQKILPKENLLITEKFYNNTLLDDVDIGSYETQAQFVKDLFENSVNKVKSDRSESENEVKAGDCKCEVKCEPGCGCICDDCYSPCWPRDWVKVDHPGARVISINYTSDPYLWRPLWVKESKRLRLHERAEQMMSQLLDLGVGERPIIWVGHSKGGLFIKKMYCEAYEAHLKLTKSKPKQEISEQTNEQNITESRNDNEINHSRDKETDKINANLNTDVNLNDINAGVKEVNEESIRDTGKQYIDKEIGQMISSENTDGNINELNEINERINDLVTGKQGNEMNINVHTDVNLNNHLNEFNSVVPRDIENKELVVNSKCFDDILMNNRTEIGNKFISEDNEGEINAECDRNGNIPKLITVDENGVKSLLNVNEEQLLTRARLWRNSAGFMFYSVPHRGSPLADIKTPITARSVELMEICKDCSLVLSLQEEWSVATRTAPTTPPVRSLVETCRTLMSVLYLRIVSVDSADPGIGSLSGVDVDHREICKPSSRSCLLYRELMTLMEAALNAPRYDWSK